MILHTVYLHYLNTIKINSCDQFENFKFMLDGIQVLVCYIFGWLALNYCFDFGLLVEVLDIVALVDY